MNKPLVRDYLHVSTNQRNHFQSVFETTWSVDERIV